MGRTAFRGFTLVELLVVIVIILILMALVVPAVFQALGAARQGAAEELMSQLVQAIKSYELDHGVYPPGDGRGSRGLVKALTEPGPKKSPAMPVREDMLTREGDFLNPVHHDREAPLNAIHYRNNAGRKPGPDGVGRPGIFPNREYDLWCAGLDEDPRRPDRAWSILRP